MKKKEVKRLIPFNLQFFAEGDGTGADGSKGDGAGTGNTGGAGTDAGSAGDTGAGTKPDPGNASDGTKPPTFDDVLKGGHQAEFDRRIQQAITTALTKQKGKYEALMDDKLSEADKLAKMTKEEKEQYLSQKHEKELTDRENAITRRELMAEAKNTLAEKKLPVSLAEVLNYTDADTCSKSIEAVEKAFQEAVSTAVEEKLKGGKPPKTAGNTATFTRAQVEAMSPEEINKNWDAVQESMKHF